MRSVGLARKESQAPETLDPLTGLPTLSAFGPLAEQRRRRAIHDGGGYGVVLVDICGLRHVNERFGRDRGDEHLRRTAELLRSTFRESDIAARIGEDEFAVFVVGDMQMMQRVGPRIEAALMEVNCQHTEGIRLSVSMGVAGNGTHGETLEELLELALESMHLDRQRRRGT